MKIIWIKLFIIFCVILVSKSFSQIRFEISGPGRDDGSTKLTKDDSTRFTSFNVERFDKKYAPKDSKEIVFETIKAEEFSSLFSKHKYTWVFIQSSWCGACLPSLKKYIKIADSLGHEDIKIVVINQDFKIKQLQKKVFSEGYFFRSYIIDPRIYGIIESQKQKKFVEEITSGAVLENYNCDAVPQNLFFDRSGRLLYYAPINAITKELVTNRVISQK
jgi:thiol-disulfide isomerase/thioredoxin